VDEAALRLAEDGRDDRGRAFAAGDGGEFLAPLGDLVIGRERRHGQP
jgi:hypothetical protein